MPGSFKIGALSIALLIGLAHPARASYPIWSGLSAQAREDVSLFLWFNESGATWDGLLQWGEGESFVSVGYGHMIWFPEGVDPGYVESFPLYLELYASQGFLPRPPRWLRDLGPFPPCPWRDSTELQMEQHSSRVEEFQSWLYWTRLHQSYFYVKRLEISMDEILMKLRAWGIADPDARVRALLQDPAGILDLVDYVNFKGEGLDSGEIRHGIPWGLSRALYWASQSSEPPVEAFSFGASRALDERVSNARQDGIDESRWLTGWLNRTDRYRDPEAIVAPLRGSIH